jgi:hypothetical protein
MTDLMQFLKSSLHENVKTVQDYIHKQILPHVREVLNDESKGVSHYYGLLDRGGNLAKKLFTSHKRSRVPPAREREDGRLSIPAEGNLPVEWDNIVANRDMANREIKPLFYRALIQVTPIHRCLFVCSAVH